MVIIILYGSNIKKYRTQRGLSQHQLANKLTLMGVNIYDSDITRMEAHAVFVRDYEQVALCKVLNITFEQLFEDTAKYFDETNS